MSEAPLLAVDGLSVTYATRSGVLRAIDGIDLSVASGEALALVGESGSGKSTVALAIMGLLGPEAASARAGRVPGQGSGAPIGRGAARLRGRDIAIVFQDPFTSLNPSLPIGLQVAEPLVYHRGLSGEAAESAPSRRSQRSRYRIPPGWSRPIRTSSPEACSSAC